MRRLRDAVLPPQLLVEAGALATFTARDAVLFFVAFELVLVPMWVLISRYGDPHDAAARTDAMLRARLANAQSAFDHNQVGDRFLALAQAGGDPRFQTSRDLGRFLLEGLARGAMTFDEQARKERLLTVVKRAVRVLNRKGDVQELWPD